MISDLYQAKRDIKRALDLYQQNTAIALFAHTLSVGYHRPGDEDLIALFDNLTLAQNFVQACRSSKPILVDGFVRHFRTGTILYHYNGSGDLIYKIASPWEDYSGIPNNLSANDPYPDGTPCMVMGHPVWCRCMVAPTLVPEHAKRYAECMDLNGRYLRKL